MTFLRRRRSTEGLERARRERVIAEERLRSAERDVVVPLRELRKRNYVAERIGVLLRGEQEDQ